MSEETTEAAEQAEQETGKGLRAQLEKALSENKALKHDKLDASFKAIGLDMNQGFGKAIAKSYDGEVSVEAVTEYAASEFGYTKPDATHPAAQQIAQGQAQVDQIGQVATSIPPTVPLGQQLAEAEAAGDYERTSAIKAARMQQMMDRQNQIQ